MNGSYDSFKTTELIINGILDSDIMELSLPFADYYTWAFGFAHILLRIRHELEDADYMSVEELAELNAELYEPLMAENYRYSFLNPLHAVHAFGPGVGHILCAIGAEIVSSIPLIYEGDIAGLTARLHLLYDSYTKCKRVDMDDYDDHLLYGTLRFLFSSYIHSEVARETKARISAQLDPACAVIDLEGIAGGRELEELCAYIRSEEGKDRILRELYLSGEFISENETALIDKFTSMDSADLISMADTYVGGFVKGFSVARKDLSKKRSVGFRFNLGFIPMQLLALTRFKEWGLSCCMMRAPFNIFTGRSIEKNGVFGANPNPQLDMDHKDDLSLVIDEDLNEIRVNALKEAFEEYKDLASVYAGPAVIEIFGEPEFVPEIKPEAPSYDENTRRLKTEYMSKAGTLTNEYILPQERSYTIISYPMPSIGDRFEEIFDATVQINTLDYELYQDVQQKIIDVLDKAKSVQIKGMGGNKTDLTVTLHELADPKHQTGFENCVADVNIPVGEVFTSPVLRGTTGTLHVSHVFLNCLEYHDLELKITDGRIEEYSCAEGAKLIEDNILYNHKTLPMGEFAIGTNTTAYMFGRKLGIENKYPILIAEKTGPHFAFGDTCYSHCEDLPVYNPDGKEMIARDNEASALRTSDPSEAYFNCHTDITIPFDELGSLSAVMADGSLVDIILEGRFVVPGCEPLNVPLEEN